MPMDDIKDIEINGHVYTKDDWKRNTPETISLLAADIAEVASQRRDRSVYRSASWEPSQCGSVLDGERLPQIGVARDPENLRAGTLYQVDGALKIAGANTFDGDLECFSADQEPSRALVPVRVISPEERQKLRALWERQSIGAIQDGVLTVSEARRLEALPPLVGTVLNVCPAPPTPGVAPLLEIPD